MWTCKRCETLNEDERDSCALCSEPKVVKEEQQRTSNRNTFPANKQKSSQYQQGFSANSQQKESEPRKINHLAILIGVLCVLLLGAVIAIVVLINRQPMYQSAPQITEPPAGPMETMVPQADANQAALIPVNENHRIVVDSIYDPVLDGSFRWGAAIDQSGTVWLWDQNDYVARPIDISDAVAIYTAGVDWSARLFVVKKDGSVWWAELYWENNLPQYGFQKISGLENITDLEILDSIDLGLFALDAQGRVWVYGRGKYGVFGMGTDEDNYRTPVVKGLPPIQKIQCIYDDGESGYSMVVAQATSGEFYYWGTNLFTNGSKTYSNAQAYLDIETTSSNWSLFWSLEGNGHASIACLDEQGHLSIYKDSTNPIEYSDLGLFILQRGGIRSFYLLDANGSVYGYGDYSSGVAVTEDYQNTSKPSYIKELSDNQSITTLAFGGWETIALYQDGRIGVWGQTDAYVSDVRFIQDESGGDFKLMSSPTDTNAETENQNFVQCGNLTLTVESTCDYSVNIIPVAEAIQHAANYEGMSFDTNQIRIEVLDESILTLDQLSFGLPVSGALVQLYNRDDQKYWVNHVDENDGSVLFNALTPGAYYFTITCESYDIYTSPDFKIYYASGRDRESAFVQAFLTSSESDYSKGFQLQLVDLAGNPISSKQIQGAALYPCVKSESYIRTWSGIGLGTNTDQEGYFIDPVTKAYALKRGSTAIITFQDFTTWNDEGIQDKYILIRAN